MASKQYYIDRIKLMLTGNLTHIEIKDETIGQYVDLALEEIARYIDETTMITVPYASCIDLTDFKHSSITNVYRAVGENSSASAEGQFLDPVQVGMWQLTSNTGNTYNFSNYASRYPSWSTIQQIGNTLSTDLAFYYDESQKKLYINTSLNSGSAVTIEYVPRYDNVEEITSDYWIDILMRMSKAIAKITIGRVRTKYSQSNALWGLDTNILEEGTAELNELRAQLKLDTQLLYPVD